MVLGTHRDTISTPGNRSIDACSSARQHLYILNLRRGRLQEIYQVSKSNSTATMILAEAFTAAFDKSQTGLAPSCYWWPDLAETSGYASMSTTPSTDLQGSPVEWSAPHMYINSLDSSLGYLESLPSTSTMILSDPAPFGYSTKVQPQIRPTLRTFNHVTRVKSEVSLPDLIET